MRRLLIAAGWARHVSIAISQQHHTELVPALQPHLPPNGVALDVGAHAGQFTKLFARMAPKGVVHAFEPSAYSRSVLRPALRLNRIRNVVVHPLGLSDVPGTLTLHTPIKRRGGMGFGLAHLGAPAVSGPAVVQTAQLTTIDHFTASTKLDRLDLIKADIEGWEVPMLDGARHSLERFRPAIYIEIDDQLLRRANASPAEIWTLLGSLGYSGRFAPSFELVGGYVGKGDYLFVPEA
jgi:FkbM family methyltransferase